MKVIFVGDKPSPKMKPGTKPFQGAACEKRLKEWIESLGVSDYEIYNQVDLRAPTNRVEFWNGKRHIYLSKTKYIALGNAASNKLKFVPHFKLPHPSGLNRLLNDKKYINECLRKAKSYLTKGKK